MIAPYPRQAIDLSQTFPATLQSLRQASDPRSSSLLQHLPPELRAFIFANLARASAIAAGLGASIGVQALGILQGTVTVFVDLLPVLTLTFFFITDVERIRTGFLRLLPQRSRLAAGKFIADSDILISGFVRGQVLLALIIGVAAMVALVVMRVPYALFTRIRARWAPWRRRYGRSAPVRNSDNRALTVLRVGLRLTGLPIATGRPTLRRGRVVLGPDPERVRPA